MKYIRTKDGIYDKIQESFVLTSNPPKYELTKNGKHIGYEVCSNCQLADTIEELCDEFVCKLKEIPTTWCSFDLDEIEEGLKTHSLKEWEWFGMIWTDEGLIYKAKMKGILPNGEVDWELL